MEISLSCSVTKMYYSFLFFYFLLLFFSIFSKMYIVECFTVVNFIACLQVSFVKTQKLHLISLDKFEGISHAGLLAAESFSKLRELKVDNCCSLVHFMQFTSLPELKSLEKLSIQRCDSLEEVFHLEISDIEGLHRVSS